MNNEGEINPVVAIILLIFLAVAAVVVIALMIENMNRHPEPVSDVDILMTLKDDGPLSDDELFSEFRYKHEFYNSAFETMQYYRLLDNLIVENYIGVETVRTYTIYHITDEGLFYLWGSCSGSDC